MKYFYDYPDDNNNMCRKEVTKEEALDKMSNCYKNLDEIIEIPCYYRLMGYRGIEITEEYEDEEDEDE